MPYFLRKSRIDPILYEVMDEKDVIKEVPVPFKLYKWPRAFPSLQRIEEWLQEEEKKLAKQTAYRLLKVKRQSTSEIMRKLMQRGFSEEISQQTTNELKGLGFINDEDYNESLIASELKRGHGPFYIEMKLRSLGLNSRAVRQTITEEMQREAIRKLLPKLKNPVSALQRRGFDLDLISSELKNFI